MLVYILYSHYKGDDSYGDSYVEILGCYKNYDCAKEKQKEHEIEYNDRKCDNNTIFYIEEMYLY